MRTILHVDMDAFYASVEQRDHPELRGKPVIVGADPKGGHGRGIVATCSYEARRYGVHSAQPISRAWKLCPEGVYVQPDMEKYLRASHSVMAILLDFSDLVEQVSVDEAFVDVGGSESLLGSGVDIARKIKARIQSEQRLTASVGVAANKFVAKVASDLRKPDGLVVVAPGEEREFLAPLPVRCLWGVGPKTEGVFKGLGIERIGQLAQFERSDMAKWFGRHGDHLWQLACGIDDRPVVPEEGFKSIGHEITFDRDRDDWGVVHQTVLHLSEKVAHRLRSHGARARTISIKFREADFTTCTRRITLSSPVDTSEAIFPVALKMVQSVFKPGTPVRLLGVSGSNLETAAAGQLSLFDDRGTRRRKLAAAIDDITQRYGDRIITRAALVRRKPDE
jgi:nucleotidyltransferase/DNA polymerase involved in DNA repair